MKVTKVIVVPHVHWDREWYFTCQESQVLAVRDFREVIEYLESHPGYPSYVLDGQMAVLDEYLRTVPEDRPRVERLVRQGRLHVGPWFTQTDEMAVGGEAIVRNLLYGMRSARDLGAVMEIGYLPDSFGQSSQMPAILNGFGISRSVFWRGQSQFCGTEDNQFWWESKDGSRVLAFQLPLGYATGKYLPSDPAQLHTRLDGLFSLLDQLSPTQVAILPNGHDQMPIQTDIDRVLEGLRLAYPDRTFQLGSLDDAMDAVEVEGADALDTVRGELLHGKRERVHRSIWSVRADNVVASVRAENLLVRQVEPLLAVSRAVGLDSPAELARQAWRLLLENHAHDSMGGCCSDAVNAQVGARAAEARERARVLSEYQMRSVTEAACMRHPCRLGLFNMACEPGKRLVSAEVLSRSGCFELVDGSGKSVDFDVVGRREVDPGLVDRQIVAAGDYRPYVCTTIQLRRDVPTIGYEVLGIREGEGSLPEPSAPRLGVSAFETDAYEVQVREDGTVDVAARGGEVSVRGAFAIECEGNAGDEYDFSPVPGGGRLLSSDVVSCIPEVCERAESYLVRVSYELGLPGDIDAWSRGETRGDASLGVDLELEFDRRSSVIGVRACLRNEASDFRARLLVPSGISSSVSYAGVQFGDIERPVVDPALEVWEREGWSERPDTIFPFLDYVALASDAATVALLSDGPREYEVVGEGHDTLAVTLLACVGMLGRHDLVRRPGRPSGICVETPAAQCHGSIEMRLGLACLPCGIDDAHLGSMAARWLAPVMSYQKMERAPIRLSEPRTAVPVSFSLLAQSDPALALSSVKPAEEGGGLIARFYNDSGARRELRLGGSGAARRLDLAEEPVDDGDAGVVDPYGIVTVEIGSKARGNGGPSDREVDTGVR